MFLILILITNFNILRIRIQQRPKFILSSLVPLMMFHLLLFMILPLLKMLVSRTKELYFSRNLMRDVLTLMEKKLNWILSKNGFNQTEFLLFQNLGFYF